MIGSILAGLATGAVNNFMSEWHADKAQDREKELMEKQNQMNKVNALDAYRNTVQGMKMAGLNPAIANDSQPVQASPVSKGSGAKGENVELSPQDLLIQAQAKNLDAQTEKIKEEAGAEKRKNDITDTSNDAAKATYLEHIDRQVAELTDEAGKLKKDSAEYGRLMDRIDQLNASKEKVKDPKFVGALGIADGIRSGAEAVKSDFDVINNFLRGKMDKEVLVKKFGKNVAEDLARMPKLQRQQLEETITHIQQMVAESESKEKLNDQTVLKLQQDIMNLGNEMIHRNLADPVWIRTHLGEDSKEWKAWTDQQWRDNAFKVGTSILQGVATGGALGAVNSMLNGTVGNKGKSNGMDVFDREIEMGKKTRDAFKEIGPFKGYHGNNSTYEQEKYFEKYGNKRSRGFPSEDVWKERYGL